jgi:hypothetical protein
MAIVSRAFQILTLSSGAACLEVDCAPVDDLTLHEISITLDSLPGAVSTFGLGVPAAQGIGMQRLVSFFEDTGSLTDTYPNIALAWQVPPTVPANFLRRGNIDNVLGQSIAWPMPKGLMNFSGSIVVWNISAVGNATINLVWED